MTHIGIYLIPLGFNIGKILPFVNSTTKKNVYVNSIHHPTKMDIFNRSIAR